MNSLNIRYLDSWKIYSICFNSKINIAYHNFYIPTLRIRFTSILFSAEFIKFLIFGFTSSHVEEMIVKMIYSFTVFTLCLTSSL